MSVQNKEVAVWTRAQGTNFTARKQVTSNPAVLHSIIINSHTTGTFRVSNGTLTAQTPIQGTYTPAAGSSVIEFDLIDCPNGILIETGGTIDATAIYNEYTV